MVCFQGFLKTFFFTKSYSLWSLCKANLWLFYLHSFLRLVLILMKIMAILAKICAKKILKKWARGLIKLQNHFYFSRFIIRNMCYFYETKTFVKCNSQNWICMFCVFLLRQKRKNWAYIYWSPCSMENAKIYSRKLSPFSAKVSWNQSIR